MSYYSNRSGLAKSGIGFIGVLVVLMIIGIVVINVTRLSVKNTYEACVVDDRDRSVEVVDGDSTTNYRIYTENCGIFEVEDNLVYGIFNAADVYSSIKVGKTYDFEAIGWRIPILSMFPAIVKVKEVGA